MNIERGALMRQIQAYSFAVVEVNLYLDTHPEDAAAIEYYNKYIALLREAKDSYECNFGPLTAAGVHGDYWTWTRDPWPWEYDCASCAHRG